MFTNEIGGHTVHFTAYKHFKAIAVRMGQPGLRFHDMRHSNAVMRLANGDNIKDVQEALGHHSAAFTLDTYGHVTTQMREESAARMQERIERLKNKA